MLCATGMLKIIFIVYLDAIKLLVIFKNNWNTYVQTRKCIDFSISFYVYGYRYEL